MTTSTPFTVRPRRSGEPELDLTGFRLIHLALRSGSRIVAAAAADVAAGRPSPPKRHDAIVYFATHVLHEIEVHHRKEDDILWPVIVESAGGQVDLDPLTSDHVALAEVLVRVEQTLAQFRANPAEAAADLAAIMTVVADELDEHIADEEATVFPVMREHVSAADFARCEKLFQKGARLPHLFFLLPWVLAQCTDAEREALRPSAPLALRLILRVAEPRWRRSLALVEGATLRP